MNVQQYGISLKATAKPIPKVGNYQPVYGTGGYLSSVIREVGDRYRCACRTRDGQCEWWELDTARRAVVAVVKGDAERVRQLVQAEFEHYDCEVVWR